ncbi:hypothetical protein COCON_G00230090 [Conger conger]|uniref:Uncharacterized protein n=1 Tax=Conger conger TaxID=82655 RepID=A0A9Q1CVC3_CONCO|nr:hypothetical protein COCON_G00230090 [Conger conger]
MIRSGAAGSETGAHVMVERVRAQRVSPPPRPGASISARPSAAAPASASQRPGTAPLSQADFRAALPAARQLLLPLPGRGVTSPKPNKQRPLQVSPAPPASTARTL